MTEPVRILCVDDEPNVLKALNRLFMDDSYEMLTVGSGQEGLELLRRINPVQVVISDYRMPEMNGVDFLKEVFAQWPDTIRIVLSGYADTAAVVDAINQGQIYKFIPKPWNDDELKFTIQNAIKFWELNHENARLNNELSRTNRNLKQVNENLEQIIADRTAELQFQNEALEHAQNILANLPLAVIGLDIEDLVVYMNHVAFDLLRPLANCNNFLGEDRRQVLPAELNRLVDQLGSVAAIIAEMTLAGRPAMVLGRRLMRHGHQDGLILAIIEQ